MLTQSPLQATRRRTIALMVRAADLMIADPFILSALTPVEEAKRQLNARRINAAPVTGIGSDEGRIVGAVTRQTLDGALQHVLGDRPVEVLLDQRLACVYRYVP